MRPALRALAISAVILAMLVGGGASVRGARRNNGNQSTEPTSHQTLVKEVRHQLLLLPYYSVFDILSYRVDGGSVTLEGSVVRPTLKSDAESAVKSVEGVSKVVNNIQVLPLSPMDDQSRAALYRAIYGDATLSRYAYSSVAAIHIIVSNGNVTLEGAVDNESDKNLAGIRANGVANVFAVKNNLAVTAATK